MSLQIYEKYLPWRPSSGKPKNYICGEKIPVVRALLIGILVFLFSSCYDKGDCLHTDTNLVGISLKRKSDGVAQSVLFSSIQIENISKEIHKDTTASSLFLPVDPTQTETVFLLNYDDKKQRIKFTYRNETSIPTSDCGAFVYQKDLEISETTFGKDSIRVINKQLIKNVKTPTINVEIFF